MSIVSSKKLVKIAIMATKALLVTCALLGLMACSKKHRAGEAGDMDAGVGDSMTFYGTELSPEQERALLAKNTYYFNYDSNDLSEEDTLSVYAHAKKIMSRPRTHVRIEGHTDERGSREYNVALGDRRGKAIANILALKGVNQSQISVVSYGKEKPAGAGHDESTWSQNRRGVIVYESQ
jgi:peptidoglycan-associated lipoprotein